MTTTTVAMTTTPCTAGMSLLSMAFDAAWPRPGSAKSCSMTTEAAEQGVVIVATVVVVVTNLLLDLVVAGLDPKVRTA